MYVLSKFIFTSFYTILTIFSFSRFGVHLVRTQKISENLTLFLISSRRTNRRKHVN